MIILHFAEKNDWDNALKTNSYGSSILSQNTSIPCFKIEDIKNLDLSFSNLKDYVILCIDETKLTSNIKYEPYKEFIEPNIYGEINKDAVIFVLPYTFDKEDKFYATKELLDFNIINNVLESLNIQYESHKYFNDGTTSRIILLNNLYIIKQAPKEQLKAEVTFATNYKDTQMLQKVAYFDNDYEFVVYNYIPGDIMHTVENFFDLSSNIKNIVSKYKISNENGFGYIQNKVNSWKEFLTNEVNDASLNFPEINYLLPAVNNAIEELSKMPFEKKLIHGDFGTHNFIKQNEKFVAAIDPIPVLGDSTYDLLFALVSNIDLIPYLSIDFLTEYTGESRAKINALLKVVLYCRICRCAKYNKDWIEPYLNFGNNLFN